MSDERVTLVFTGTGNDDFHLRPEAHDLPPDHFEREEEKSSEASGA